MGREGSMGMSASEPEMHAPMSACGHPKSGHTPAHTKYTNSKIQPARVESTLQLESKVYFNYAVGASPGTQTQDASAWVFLYELV